MLALALPSCIASLTFVSGMLALVFIGPYGTDAIAGAGLGFMWTNGETLLALTLRSRRCCCCRCAAARAPSHSLKLRPRAAQ